jgi:acyl carrier protein
MNTESSDIDAARAMVAKALSVALDQIGPETRMYDIPAWDSLGQLSVILTIEETRFVQITDDAMFARLTSVRGIASYIASTSSTC